MNNWPEKVYGQVSITGDKCIAAWKLNDNRPAIEYTRSDLALPDDLKEELLEALKIGHKAIFYMPSDMQLLAERNMILTKAIERLNGVKS